MQHLVIAAMLATLAAGLISILILGRYLGERSPRLFRTLTVNLVLFNLLAAVGLGYRLVEEGPSPAGPTVWALHLLAALVLVLSVLKVAWLRALAAVALALRQRTPPSSVDRAAAVAATLFGLAALGGWVHAIRAGRLGLLMVVALASDAFAMLAIGAVAAWLWRESFAAAGVAARRAMRWFSIGNLAVVASAVLSFAAGAVWSQWSGALQALAHSLALLAYEVLLVAWAVRWAGVWAEELRTGAGEGQAFALATERYGLSKREREVAALLCGGRTNQEIADELFVALQTIKDHNYHIFQKVGVRNRTELARRLTVPSPGGSN